MTAPAEFETMDANEDGWTDWIHPREGYRMKCCDCGLVHVMDARVGKVVERKPDGTFEWDDAEGGDLVVMFRMSREDDPPKP